MLKGMTGFGSRSAQIKGYGNCSVVLRSTNHKFQEVLLHSPENLLPLEERIKKLIEEKVKRGRVTCVINLTKKDGPAVFINKPLLKRYVSEIEKTRRQFKIKGEVGMDVLIGLPGVLSAAQEQVQLQRIWPSLQALVRLALSDLIGMRAREGRSLYRFLNNRVKILKAKLESVKRRVVKVNSMALSRLKSDEEKSSFLRESDISEEIERLSFYAKNLRAKLSKAAFVGKELDFIAQEMQREANTMGAKSADTGISSLVVQIKSQIEKMREQIQNVE